MTRGREKKEDRNIKTLPVPLPPALADCSGWPALLPPGIIGAQDLRQSLLRLSSGVSHSTQGLCLPGERLSSTFSVWRMLMFSNLSLFSPCFISFADQTLFCSEMNAKYQVEIQPFFWGTSTYQSRCRFLCFKVNERIVTFYNEKGLKVSFAVLPQGV